MSLFQLRDWWRGTTDAQEEFDKGCMVLANIDNAENGNEKIITGSFHGTLRIFYPKSRGFKIEDLLLEHRFDLPILQLLVGRFSPHSEKLFLAVLHPRQLAVYAVAGEGQTNGEASYYTINKLYDHSLGEEGLHFTAANMVAGPFGGVDGKDLLCVQSMDGGLAFFEQDRPSFTVKLPDVLAPGPLHYLPKMDVLVTCTTRMCVEAFKYHALAAAASSSGGGMRSGRKEDSAVRVDWSVNIGEHAVDIRTGRLTKGLRAGQTDILVLGEHTLFALGEEGGVRMQKRLDFDTSVAVPFRNGSSDTGAAVDSLLVGTHHQQVRVYADTRLVWAARCTETPVELAVGTFGGQRGLVCTMDEAGTVTLSYLGTEPPSKQVAVAEARELDFAAMDAEHRRLLSVIREAQSRHRSEPRDRLVLRARVPRVCDEVGAEAGEAAAAAVGEEAAVHLARGLRGNVVQCTAQLLMTFVGQGAATDVTLALDVPDSVVAREAVVHIPTVDGVGSTPLVVPLVFWATARHGVPASLEVTVVATHTTPKGEPRTAKCSFTLPLCMAGQLVPPVKQAVFKFTLDSAADPCPLSTLFPDLLALPGMDEEELSRVAGAAANALTLRYYCGVECTVLASKSAGRYRVQAPTLEALWMLAGALVSRLREKAAADADGDAAAADAELGLSYGEPLPLADFFATIDAHHAQRAHVRECRVALDARAQQLRVVQKRLLTRFKDRTPTPLNHLDALMASAHESVIAAGTAVEEAEEAEKGLGMRLACAAELMVLLMQYRFGLDDANATVLRAHMCPSVREGTGGWEETADAAVTHLLRTVLSKSGKDSGLVSQQLEMPDSTEKLKKHITILCDRLAKGGRLIAPPKERRRKPRAPVEAEPEASEENAGPPAEAAE